MPVFYLQYCLTEWEYLISLLACKITLLMIIDALYKVGNTYFFMVDEKMTCALNSYRAVFASFCVSKNIKQIKFLFSISHR